MYNNITSRVLLNEKTLPKIKIRRSVRQGYPLSMLLWIWYLEPLIFKIRLKPQTQGVKIPNCYQDQNNSAC